MTLDLSLDKMSANSSPEAYCAEVCRQSGSNFRLSFYLLRKEKRHAIEALYAFCRTIDNIVDNDQDEVLARQQLQEWRNKIEFLFNDQPNHPITVALLPAVRRYRLPRAHFEALIDGMEMDLNQTTYQTFADLYQYCYRAASVVGLLIARILGYRDQDTEIYAESLGIALQLTNILRDIGEDLEMGRCYIPLDIQERFQIDMNKINPEKTQPMFIWLDQQAEHYYQNAAESLPHSERSSQLTGIVMGALYHRLLAEIRRLDYPVLHQRVSLSLPKKLSGVIKGLVSKEF